MEVMLRIAKPTSLKMKLLKYQRKVHQIVFLSIMPDIAFFNSRLILHRKFELWVFLVSLLGFKLLVVDFIEILIQTFKLKNHVPNADKKVRDKAKSNESAMDLNLPRNITKIKVLDIQATRNYHKENQEITCLTKNYISQKEKSYKNNSVLLSNISYFLKIFLTQIIIVSLPHSPRICLISLILTDVCSTFPLVVQLFKGRNLVFWFNVLIRTIQFLSSSSLFICLLAIGWAQKGPSPKEVEVSQQRRVKWVIYIGTFFEFFLVILALIINGIRSIRDIVKERKEKKYGVRAVKKIGSVEEDLMIYKFEYEKREGLEWLRRKGEREEESDVQRNGKSRKGQEKKKTIVAKDNIGMNRLSNDRPEVWCYF